MSLPRSVLIMDLLLVDSLKRTVFSDVKFAVLFQFAYFQSICFVMYSQAIVAFIFVDFAPKKGFETIMN